MSKLRKLWGMAAMMGALAMCENPYSKDDLDETGVKVKCGTCKHCPKNGKRFCQKVRHNVSSISPAHNCMHYEAK